ncbi:MAG: hypothetical protein AB8B51_14295 [Sedimentitalea sp.]
MQKLSRVVLALRVCAAMVSFCCVASSGLAGNHIPIDEPFEKVDPATVDDSRNNYMASHVGPTKRVKDLTKGWMGKLSNYTVLGEISIPGSHNSLALDCGLICTTQRWSLGDQLDAGVRFFDIRVERVDGVLQVRHGSSDLGVELLEVMWAFTTWLEKNPSEALIVVLQEQEPDSDEESFADLWKKNGLKPYEKYFVREADLASGNRLEFPEVKLEFLSLPERSLIKLSQVPLYKLRGKILLWKRRISSKAGEGSPISDYGFNTKQEDATIIRWQNNYGISAFGAGDSSSPSQKKAHISANMAPAIAQNITLSWQRDKGGAMTTTPLYVNFIGGSVATGNAIIGALAQDPKKFSPLHYAVTFNNYTYDLLLELCPLERRCGVGIVYGDFLSADLIYNIIRTNF